MRRALALAAAMLFVVAPPATAATSLSGRIVEGIRVVRHDRIPTSYPLTLTAVARATYLAKLDRLEGDNHRGFIRTAAANGVTSNRWSLIGEIYAFHINAGSTADWYVKAWLASPTHRAVLLGRWTHLGASCRRNLERTWCVVIFGKKR